MEVSKLSVIIFTMIKIACMMNNATLHMRNHLSVCMEKDVREYDARYVSDDEDDDGSEDESEEENDVDEGMDENYLIKITDLEPSL